MHLATLSPNVRGNFSTATNALHKARTRAVSRGAVYDKAEMEWLEADIARCLGIAIKAAEKKPPKELVHIYDDVSRVGKPGIMVGKGPQSDTTRVKEFNAAWKSLGKRAEEFYNTVSLSGDYTAQLGISDTDRPKGHSKSLQRRLGAPRASFHGQMPAVYQVWRIAKDNALILDVANPTKHGLALTKPCVTTHSDFFRFLYWNGLGLSKSCEVEDSDFITMMLMFLQKKFTIVNTCGHKGTPRFSGMPYHILAVLLAHMDCTASYVALCEDVLEIPGVYNIPDWAIPEFFARISQSYRDGMNITPLEHIVGIYDGIVEHKIVESTFNSNGTYSHGLEIVTSVHLMDSSHTHRPTPIQV